MWENDKLNIETIAVVFRYFDKEEYGFNANDELTFDEWKKIVGRYNTIDKNKQENYSNKVFEYLPHVRELLD